MQYCYDKSIGQKLDANDLTDFDRKKTYFCNVCKKKVTLCIKHHGNNYFKHLDSSPNCPDYSTASGAIAASPYSERANFYGISNLDFSNCVELGHYECLQQISKERRGFYTKNPIFGKSIRNYSKISDFDGFEVRHPYIFFDSDENTDENHVYLIIPEQKVYLGNKNAVTKIGYKIMINNETEMRYAETRSYIIQEKLILVVEQIEIPIKERLKLFHVQFPYQLSSKSFVYRHSMVRFYAFHNEGLNLGKMFYISDFNAINELPEKKMWILVSQEFTDKKNRFVKFENKIWKNYSAYNINCAKSRNIKFENPSKTIVINRRENWKLLRNQNTMKFYDDFQGIPIYSNERIFLANKDGTSPKDIYLHWSKNGFSPFKWSSSKLIKAKFQGTTHISLAEYIREILFNEKIVYGNFCIKICPSTKKYARKILFFKIIPMNEINIPSNIFWNSKFKQCITLNLSQPYWNLRENKTDSDPNTKIGIKEKTINNQQIFTIETPYELDHFEIILSHQTKANSAVAINLTIPRLKWRGENEENWTSELIVLSKDDLVYGIPYIIQIKDNISPFYESLSVILCNYKNEAINEIIEKKKMLSFDLQPFFDNIKNLFGNWTINLKITTKEKKFLVPIIRITNKIKELVQKVKNREDILQPYSGIHEFNRHPEIVKLSLMESTQKKLYQYIENLLEIYKTTPKNQSCISFSDIINLITKKNKDIANHKQYHIKKFAKFLQFIHHVYGLNHLVDAGKVYFRK